jgi:DNA-binding SARP family transcriptional activator
MFMYDFYFDVLGSLEVRNGGQAIRLGRTLTVIVEALLSADKYTLSTARLEELVWADGRDISPDTLRSNICHLRQKFGGKDGGGAVVATEPLGYGQTSYGLAVRPERTDICHFDRCITAGRRNLVGGRYEEAVSQFSAALDLWRGDPFKGAGARPFAIAARVRLENQRLVARVGLAEAQICLGHHHEVAGILQQLVIDHPEHGGIHGLLIQSLNRSHRKIEAARAAENAMKSFSEYGLNDHALRRLQQDLLRGDLAMNGPLAS